MKCQTFWAGGLLGAWTLLSVTNAQPTARPVLSVSGAPGNRIELTWPSSSGNFRVEQRGALNEAPWQEVLESPTTRAGNFVVSVVVADSSRFYRLRGDSVPKTFQVLETAPMDGATEVGVTFRPKVTFSEAVNPSSLTTNSFYATAAGRFLDATVVPANDGTFAWLFFKQAMPGGTDVRVTLDGSRILSARDGLMLDPDGDGLPGGVADFQFTTVSVQGLPGTSLSGIVADPGPDTIPRTADDFDAGADGRSGTLDDQFLLPIAGVKVFLLGREEQSMTTGADGRFHFDSVPVGDVKVVIDGRTAVNPPAGRYFPEMVIDAQMVAGRNNWTMTNGPEVYLPRLASTILQTIDVTKTNLIQTTPEGAQGLSAFQRSQLSIELAPNSLIGADGRALSSGQIGISTVPSDIVRDMLPPGVLQHTFDITVQAPGIATFATPAPMTFPNMFNAAPGTKLNFLSFDHTTGRLVIEGTATVSADGTTVRTDPGTGITHPGWHGLTPPGAPNDPQDRPDPLCQDELISADLADESLDVPAQPLSGHEIHAAAVQPGPLETEGLQDYFFKAGDDETFTLRFRNTSAPVAKMASACDPQNAGPKPLVVKISIEGNTGTNRFLDGLDKFVVRPFLLKPGQEKRLKVSLVSLLKNINKIEVDRLYGAKVVIKSWQQGSPTALLLDKAIYIGRYLDAADADHMDGILSLADTAAGPGRPQFPRIVRRRSWELRGVPLELRRRESTASPLSVEKTDLLFAPTVRGPRTSETLEVINQNQKVIGTLVAEGEAKFQEYSVNVDGIRAVLVKAAAGQIDGVTTEQKAFLNETGALDSIITNTLKQIDVLLEPYAQGISRLTTDPGDGITITRFTSVGANVKEETLGRSDAIDFCSLDGSTCFQKGATVVPAPLTNLLGLYTFHRSSKSELTYRLSKALNRRSQGNFEMYIDHFLTAKRKDGQPYVLNAEKLVTEMVSTVVHEIGHCLGLVHTYNAAVKRSSGGCGCALGPNLKPLKDYGADIMAHGETLGARVFTISGSAFQVALGLDYVPSEATRVLDYFAANVRGAQRLKLGSFLQGFDGNDGSDDYSLPSEPGGLAVSLDGESASLLSSIDFGRVLVQAPIAGSGELNLLLNNVGDSAVSVSSVRIVGAGDAFKVGIVPTGTQIPPNESIALPVRFDPFTSGPANATLVITHDGVDGITEIDLTGIGYREGPDISVFVENNNLGGARIGGPAKVARGFGTITNLGTADLTIASIAGENAEPAFSVVGLPTFSASNPLRLKPGSGISFDVSFSPSAAGLVRGVLRFLSNDTNAPALKLRVMGTGLLPSGSALDYGNDFVAMESPDFPEAPVLRAKSDQNGNFSFFLPPEQRYHSVIFDPVSGGVVSEQAKAHNSADS